MEFGIGIIPNNNLNEIIEISKLVEDVGFEYLWIADNPNHNIFHILEKIAYETETIKIGPGVTNPYIKKPNELVHEIQHINQISKERAILGIGPGDKQTLDKLNIPWDSPIRTLQKSFETLSQINSQNSKHEIPFYLEASSPKLLELGGKYTNGVLINASHPLDFENIFTHIEKGINSTEKDISKFEIIAYTTTSISKDIKIAKNASRILVTFIIAGSSPQVLEKHEVPLKIKNKVYSNLCKGNIGEAIRFINDDLIEQFSVTGTPDDIIMKINSLEKKGVTQYVAGPPIGKDVEESIRLLGEVIASF